MPIYPGSTSNITLYPSTPTELNITLYPPAESGSIPALVQYSAATTADGSAAGVSQVLTNTIDVPTTITGSGNVNLTVYAAGFNGGVPLVVPCAVVNGDNAGTCVSKIATALVGNATYLSFFDSDTDSPNVLVPFLTPNFNDPTAYFTVTPTTATGINASTSTITTDGALAGCSAQMPGSMIVTGIGAGEYTYRQQINGKPAFNLLGQPTSEDFYLLVYDGGAGPWNMIDGNGDIINQSTTNSDDLPSDASWTGSTVTASNITAGNQVFVGISYDRTAVITTATFVGGGEGTLTLVPDSTASNNPGGLKTAWYRGTAAGGETGVQFITSDPVRLSIQAMEFSGVGSGAAFGTNTNSGTSASPTTGELDNTGHANSLIVGVIADTESDLANMTALTGLGVTGGGAIYQTVGYIITTIEDSYVGQSTTMADGNYAGSIAGFDPA